MNVNDDIINQLLIDSDFELSDSDSDENNLTDDIDNDPDFTVYNREDNDSYTTHVSETSESDLDAASPGKNINNTNLPISTGRKPGRPRKTPLVTSATTPVRTWRPDDNVINNYAFNPNSETIGINPDLFEVLLDGTPFDFFKLIINDEIIIKIVEETNNYAQQKINLTPISKFSRLSKWVPTTVEEIQNWLGLVLWMGLVQMPEVEMYWSNSTLFSTSFGKIISRNRFQLLTSMIHYQNNETANKNNRLYKLGTLIDDVMINSNNCMVPSEIMCIDESVIPFTGRLLFKQYIKNKRHKYGIKLFKLCIPPNYTISVKVYSGKEATVDGSVATNLVMELTDPFLNFGRTMVVDNWYTSIELAEILGQHNTYLIGTLRANRKSNPKEIIQKRLKKGESYSLRSNTNVMVMKWRDKRELLMCSTKTTNMMIDIEKRCKVKTKPITVLEYNQGKSSIDLSDQKASYSNPLRRSLKWYRKVFIDIILNIGVVNSSHLYNSVTKKKTSITYFRTSLVESLIKKSNIVYRPLEKNHQLVAVKKGRCYKCYMKTSAEKGRRYAQSHSLKVRTMCLLCNRYVCQTCFNDTHRSVLI